MNAVLNFYVLYVVILIIIQFLLQTFILIYLAKRKGLLKFPIAGLEYSQVVFVTVIIFGGCLVEVASINNIFQILKTVQHAGEPVYLMVFVKFSQLFFIVLVLLGLYWILVYFSSMIFFGFRKPFDEIVNGNLPASFLISGVSLSYAVILYFMADELLEMITPKFLVFN